MGGAQQRPGRPRKWSSDAERMRAARAAKRETQRAADERGAARRQQHERRTREKSTTVPTTEQLVAPAESTIPEPHGGEHVAERSEVDRLRAEVRRLEDEYDDVVYDRWIFETQYRMAICRLQQHDPEGLAWLDEQLRRWALQREGELEDRRRARRSWQVGQL
jgi:hypothetical protein